MQHSSQLTDLLKAHGYSLTAARRTVLSALQGQEPLTMHQLVNRCGAINRASVYRTVALFEQLGIIERLQTGWKYKLELSGNFHEHHHHATCLHCNKTFILAEDPSLERNLHQLAATINFRLDRHQLELQGYCTDCRALPPK